MPKLSSSSDYSTAGYNLSASLAPRDRLGLDAGSTDLCIRRVLGRNMSRTPQMKSNLVLSAEGVPAARLLSQAGRGSSTLTSALSLRFETLDLNTALTLIGRWHSQLPRLDKRVAAWLCYGARSEGNYVAAAVWSLPVARLLPQDGSCL